jgi:guanylate kinase
MEKGNEYNFTSKQEFKSFFKSHGEFLLEKREISAGEGI